MVKSDLKELYDISVKIKKGKADIEEEAKYLPLSIELIHYLNGFEDDDMLHIIYYKYMLGLGWERISDICGSFSPDAIRKACTRSLAKYEKDFGSGINNNLCA